MPFKASAPGSLMLLGEYGVLQGEYALVCAIDRRINVTLSPRSDKQIRIFSCQTNQESEFNGTSFPDYVTSIEQLSVESPFQFVLGVLKHYQNKLTDGCSIQIESEFSDQVGLGSSAAVTVATLAVLASWLEKEISLQELVRKGRLIVQSVQGMGSGADVAASVYGGIVAYCAQPLVIEKYTTLYPLSVLYAGFKVPTCVAVEQVNQYFFVYPQIFRQLCRSIGRCALEGIQQVKEQAWLQLGKIMTIQQGLLVTLGVNTPLLQDMVDSLCAQPNILGAKISGSGLGDCVIGLGSLSDTYVYTACSRCQDKERSQAIAGRTSASDFLKMRVKRIPVQMTRQGVQFEKI